MKEMMIDEFGKVGRSFWILKNFEYLFRKFEIYFVGDRELWKDFK